MDITTRATDIADAIRHRDIARVQFHAAKTRTAKRAADETLDFWMSRVAFLTSTAPAPVEPAQ